MTDEEIEAARETLTETGRRYRRSDAAFKRDSKANKDAALAALRAGIGPSEVARLSTFTDAYIRRLAREAGIPPARETGYAKRHPEG